MGCAAALLLLRSFSYEFFFVAEDVGGLALTWVPSWSTFRQVDALPPPHAVWFQVGDEHGVPWTSAFNWLVTDGLCGALLLVALGELFHRRSLARRSRRLLLGAFSAVAFAAALIRLFTYRLLDYEARFFAIAFGWSGEQPSRIAVADESGASLLVSVTPTWLAIHAFVVSHWLTAVLVALAALSLERASRRAADFRSVQGPSGSGDPSASRAGQR